ncbi:MAG: LysM peptidoglycan-binding domain-containing protein [Anaerolineales bacterium]
MPKNITPILTLTGLFVLLALSWSLVTPALASAPALQATLQPTPTPGADGRILYTVLAGDSPLLIAEKFGLDYQQLRILNNWGENEVLVEGQVILLGLGSQGTATAVVGPTSDLVATITPETPGTGAICVLLFNDVNGDALRQDTELGIADGAASISERTGLASRTGVTVSILDVDGVPEPTCFTDLPVGEYTVSAAAPEGYNPTTTQSSTIQLHPGDQTTLNFGAQASSSSGLGGLSPEEGGRSPLMGLLGIVLILGGAGLGAYTWQMARRRR